MYRDDLEALAARHAAVTAEVAVLERERDALGRSLAEARTRARLPVLANLSIATPCHENWGTMLGDSRVRSCVGCKQNVYNLSELTADEAHGLLVERGPGLCVRYYQRADGTIMFRDCQGAWHRRARRYRYRLIGAVALAIGAAATLATVVEGVPEEHVLTDAEIQELLRARPYTGKYEGVRPRDRDLVRYP